MTHHIATINGQHSFAYAGEPAWHGLGQQIYSSDSIEAIAQKAGLNWTALRQPRAFTYDFGAGVTAHHELDGFALVRSDTLPTPERPDVIPIVLGEVSNAYKPVQPTECLHALNEMAVKMGATLETAGALREGRVIFGLLRFPASLYLGREDEVARYATIYTSFDGTLATTLVQTSIRIVCANTLRLSVAQRASMAGRGLIRFTHVQDSQLSDMNLTALADQWTAFTRWSEACASAPMSLSDTQDFIHAVATQVVDEKSEIDMVTAGRDRAISADLAERGRALGRNKAKDKEVESELAPARRAAKIDDLSREILHSAAYAPGSATESAKGTLWGAVNAVTHAMTAGAGVRRKTKQLAEKLTAERLGIGAGKWEDALRDLVDQVLSRPAQGISLDDIISVQTDDDGAVRAGVLS